MGVLLGLLGGRLVLLLALLLVWPLLLTGALRTQIQDHFWREHPYASDLHPVGRCIVLAAGRTEAGRRVLGRANAEGHAGIPRRRHCLGSEESG